MQETRKLDRYNQKQTNHVFNILNGYKDHYFEQGFFKQRTRNHKHEYESILQIFTKHKYITLNGLKSSGKTIFLNNLIHYLSSGFTKKLNSSIADLTPFKIDLSKTNTDCRITCKSLIQDQLKLINGTESIIEYEVIFKLLIDQKLLLVFDNYSNAKDKIKINKILLKFKNKYKNHMVIIKSFSNRHIKNSFFNSFYDCFLVNINHEEIKKITFNKFYDEKTLKAFSSATNRSLLLNLNIDELKDVDNEIDLYSFSIKKYIKKFFSNYINSNNINLDVVTIECLISKIAFYIKSNKYISRNDLNLIIKTWAEYIGYKDTVIEDITNIITDKRNPLIELINNFYKFKNNELLEYLSFVFIKDQISNPEFFDKVLDEDSTIDPVFLKDNKELLSFILNDKSFNKEKIFLFDYFIENQGWIKKLNKLIY